MYEYETPPLPEYEKTTHNQDKESNDMKETQYIRTVLANGYWLGAGIVDPVGGERADRPQGSSHQGPKTNATSSFYILFGCLSAVCRLLIMDNGIVQEKK